jgi:ferredoxin
MTPVAMCYADGQCPEHAARLFESACDLISTYGKRGENTVAAFRSLLADLKQAKTFNEAYAQLPESLFQASKLDDEVARRANFERLRAEGFFK